MPARRRRDGRAGQRGAALGLLLLVAALLLPDANARPARALPPAPPDDFAALAQRATSDPRDPRAFVWLYRLEGLRDLEPSEAPYRALLDHTIANASAPALLRDHARWLRVRAEFQAGEEAAGDADRAALGVPPSWAVVGPFDNLGNRAFDADVGPAADGFSDFGDAHSYQGKYGTVQWHFLPDVARAGGLSFRELFDAPGDDELLAYAATGVRLKRAAAVDLRVGSSDSVRVWVDGTVVLTRDVRREGFPDQDTVRLALAAGPHRVVAKVGRQDGPWQLLLRFTAPDGGPLAGLSYATTVAELEQTGSAPATPGAAHPPEPIAALRAAVAAEEHGAGGADAEAVAALGRLEALFHPDDHHDEVASRLLERACALAPKRADFRVALAHAVQGDDDRARTALEAAVTVADAADAAGGAEAATAAHARAVALEALASRALGRGEVEKATAWAARLRTVAPTHPLPTLVDARRRADDGFPAMAMALAAPVAERLPRYLPALGTARELARVLGDPAAERRWAEAQLRRDAGDRAARGAVIELRARDPGISTADDLVAAVAGDPYNLELRLARLATLLREDRLEPAEAALRDDQQHFPESFRLAAAAGDLALRKGATTAALAAFDESLALRPQQQELQRRREYHAAAAAAAPVGEDEARLRELAAEPITPACREAGACVLVRDERTEVQPSGLAARTVEFAFRLLDVRMRDAMRDYVIPFVPGEHRLEVLSAARLSADGDVRGPTAVYTQGPAGKVGGMYTLENARVVRFDDLQPGDVVRVRHRLDDVVARNPFGDFFGEIHPFEFRGMPLLAASFELRVPATRDLHVFEQGVPAAEVRSEDATRVYRWAVHDLPGIPWEERMPGYSEYGPYVSVSTFGSWQALNDWYADLVREQRRVDDDVRAVVHGLTDGVEDRHERMRRVYDWVVTNTRYVGIEFGIHGFQPYPVTQIFQRGYGDCKDKSFLLVAMLAEAGIEAFPVLLRTRDRGMLADRPATLWAFNHVITYVPEFDAWLDGTNEFAGSGELHPLDQDAMALVVHDGGRATLTRTPIVPADRNREESEDVVTLATDGSATFSARDRESGAAAFAVRRLLQEPARRQETIEKLLSDDFPGARVTRIETSDTHALESDVTLSFDATVPALASRSGTLLQTRVALQPSHLAELVSTSSRRYDLVLDHTRLARSTTRFVPPPGEVPYALPKGGEVSSPFGHFRLQVAAEGDDAVRVDSELRIDVLRVAVPDYGAFRNFCLAVDALERQPLSFTTRP